MTPAQATGPEILREIEPTAKEAAVIKELKALAKRWPKSLWLFSASGSLCVMRAKPDGTKHYQSGPAPGVDPAYVLAKINIPNDGGDW